MFLINEIILHLIVNDWEIKLNTVKIIEHRQFKDTLPCLQRCPAGWSRSYAHSSVGAGKLDSLRSLMASVTRNEHS